MLGHTGVISKFRVGMSWFTGVWGDSHLLCIMIHQEMDIESLEAANQSLQADLKLAFKRIGDLQAAIEDEMVDSDGDDDLVNK